ncbi:MAG TPA: hypothetical protein VFS43_13835 [Polyangiaceae bacterium]|nr:hypothetical protein [Polyangiaceae bacterium]
MKAKELSGTALTFAGLAAGIFGAMQASDGQAWPLGVPLCLLALPLLVMGYRLLQLPSSMADVPRGSLEGDPARSRPGARRPAAVRHDGLATEPRAPRAEPSPGGARPVEPAPASPAQEAAP